MSLHKHPTFMTYLDIIFYGQFDPRIKRNAATNIQSHNIAIEIRIQYFLLLSTHLAANSSTSIFLIFPARQSYTMIFAGNNLSLVK